MSEVLAGFVQQIQRPDNRWTAYQHDALGNIICSDYYDGTWETFSYDKNGSLQEMENAQVTVKPERDPSGQVILLMYQPQKRLKQQGLKDVLIIT